MAAARPYRPAAATDAAASPRSRFATGSAPGAAWAAATNHPPTAYLQIQEGDGGTTRVVPLGATPVRIGRGIQCEVRLAQVGLGDIQCMIRRRGDDWHFQPIGPPGRIWIDGRPADSQRTLAIGSVIQVGRSVLLIRQADPTPSGQVGSFDTPITIHDTSTTAPPPAAAIAEPPVAEPVDLEPAPPEPAPPEPTAGPFVAPAEAAPAAVAPPPEAVPTAEPTAPESPAADRARRWQSRLDQRDQWLRDRQSEKRWEARWRAAGESIRARSGRPEATNPPPAAAAAPAPAAEPTPSPPSPSPVAPGPPGRPPLVRPAEPRPVFGPRRPRPEPTAPTEPARVPHRPEPVAPARETPAPPPELSRPPLGVARVRGPVPPAPLGPESGPAAAPSPLPLLPPESPGLPLDQRSEAPSPPVGLVADAGPVDAGDRDAAPGPVLAALDPPLAPPPPTAATVRPALPTEAPAADFADVAAALAALDAPAAVLVPESREYQADATDATDPTAAPPEAEQPSPSVVASPSVPKAAPRPQRAPRATPTPAATPPPTAEAAPVAAPLPGSTPPRAERPERVPPAAASEAAPWPTARAIFAAQATRAVAAPEGGAPVDPALEASARSVRSARVDPEPTALTRPEAWTVPTWLGGGVAALVILGAGLLAIPLALVWMQDDLAGAAAVRLATRPAGTRASAAAVDGEALARTAWWQTTASHLAAWALTLDRLGPGEDRSAEARNLEGEARAASPLGARARFLSEPVPGREADDGTIRLGPTRDVVTLAALGGRLRRQGQREDAVRAYATAFRLAATTPRATLGVPPFRPNDQINRYALPHSVLLDDVARSMAGAGDWTADEWRATVPEFGPALLAVAASLRASHPGDADRRLDALATADPETPLDPQFEVAEHHAALGEALAERERWAEALARYRSAIDRETRDLDRRVWWFNLAEIARRGGDEPLRNQAIEHAKGADLSDEVTRRAANAHRFAGDPAGAPRR